MLIKIDDTVSINTRSILPRQGKITDISLALTTGDPAGENGIKVQEYETDMGYNGSIGYVTENEKQRSTYVAQ